MGAGGKRLVGLEGTVEWGKGLQINNGVERGGQN